MRHVPNYVQRFLSRLDGVRETPSGWVSHCSAPGHGVDGEDRRPSLRISIGEKGKVLIRCRVGCDNRRVLEALGVPERDLFCPEGETPMEPLTTAPSSGSEMLSEELAALRDRVYSSALQRLALTPDDAIQLASLRGLGPEAVSRNRYRTITPGLARQITLDLYAEFKEDLYSVPGFELSPQGGPNLHGRLSHSGVVVPCRDATGRIVGLKTRRRGDDQPKYLAWSAPPANSCGVLAHCPVRGEACDLNTVRVTEGELKADATYAISGLYTVSIPGVGNWKSIFPVLERLRPRRVLLSWDHGDCQSKPEVASALDELADQLDKRGYEVGLESWNAAQGKGIDDALHNGLEIKQQWGADGLKAVRALYLALCGLEAEEKGLDAWTPTPFPLQVFPPQIVGFIRQVAESLQAAPDYAAVGVLAACARACGVSRALKHSDGWEVLPSLFAIIVADSSWGKSPSLRQVLQPIKERQKRAFRKAKEERKRHQEYKKYLKGDTPEPQWLKDAVAASPNYEPPPPPPMEHFWSSDITTESIAPRLITNAELGRMDASLLIHVDECLAWIRGMNAYRGGKGADKEKWLSMGSNEEMKVDRKTGDESLVVGVNAVTVLGGIQPDMLSQLRPEGEHEDGFLPRVMLCYPKPEPFYRPRGFVRDASLDAAWSLTLNRLFALRPRKTSVGPKPKILTFSLAAQERYNQWLNRIANDVDDPLFEKRLRALYGKLRIYMARFSLLLHMLRYVCQEEGENVSETEIDVQDVANGELLCAYTVDHYRGVLRQMPVGPADRRVLDFVHWVHNERRGRVSLKDVYRGRHFDCKGLADAEKLAKQAEDRGWGEIRWETDARGKKVGCFLLVKRA